MDFPGTRMVFASMPTKGDAGDFVVFMRDGGAKCGGLQGDSGLCV